MRFDLVDLRLFLCVAEAANITHGAAKANMALASASERIRGMEETFGMALFERIRRGVRLTPAGRVLVHHAQLILQQVEHMRSDLSQYTKGLKGHVRLLANASAASEYLPQSLDAFLADNPGIDIDIEEKPSYDIIRRVAEGFADIGIVADIVDFGGLETFPFVVDPLVLVMPRGHACGRRKGWFFHELLAHEFVGLSAANVLQQHLGQRATQAGQPLKLRVRLSSFDAVCRMVENNIGLAIIPQEAAQRCAKTMAIRTARLKDAWALRHLHICIRGQAALPAPALQLLHHLQTAARTLA